MSIRPVDFQIAIQKTDQHSKDFNINNRVAVQQQGIASDVQKQAMINQQQVVSTTGSKYKKIDRNSQDKPGFKNKQGKKKQKNDRGNSIDITV